MNTVIMLELITMACVGSALTVLLIIGPTWEFKKLIPRRFRRGIDNK